MARPSQMKTLWMPFLEDHQLFQCLDEYVPGHPLVRLQSRDDLEEFLQKDLSTARVARMYWLLFFVSKPHNISPLHHQAVKGRQILITERPDLHLVWYPGCIFIKPLPKYLTSFAFCNNYLLASGDKEALRREANGFIRTYASLITYQSDFDIAKENKLLPATIEWEQWCDFIQDFRPVRLRDSEVALRYHYGELRLQRLNVLSAMFLYDWNYFRIHRDRLEYLSRLMPPFLFMFGAITLLLTALQTDLAAQRYTIYESMGPGSVRFAIVLLTLALTSLPLIYLIYLARELLLFILFRRHIS